MSVHFQKINQDQPKQIQELSVLASSIVKKHFDPIIGEKQNDYMLAKFQSEQAITQQIKEGYRYYFVIYDDQKVGFLAFYPRNQKMYLSKFYIDERWRGHHLARKMLDFVISETKKSKLQDIELNVNKNNDHVIQVYEHLGFQKIREKK